MPIHDLTNKRIDAFDLNNKKIAEKQKQLATGKRINSVKDDPAGFTITEKLDVRTSALRRSFDNVGYAKNVLFTAESGLSGINDIISQIREKAVQANNATYGDDERQAIANEISQLAAGIDDIIGDTKFNGQELIGANGLVGEFQVGADAGDEFSVDLSTAVDSGSLGLGGLTANDLTSGNIGTLFSNLDNALGAVTGQLQNIGSGINRLGVKEENLSVAITNTDAATSRIRDIDLAQAQSQLLQAQILQNTQTAQLSQANISANTVSGL